MQPRNWIVFALFFLSACANPMATYYKSIATTATMITTGYRLLDAKDKEVQAGVVARAKAGDPTGAAAELQAYLPKYDVAKKALDGAAEVVKNAESAGPLIEAAATKQRDVSGWIVRLTTLAATVSSSLAAMGVRL